MKYQSSIKKRCPKCALIRRKRRLFMLCFRGKHKQRQN